MEKPISRCKKRDIKAETAMDAPRINRLSCRAIILLSFIALLAVLSGYFQAPQPDEGSAAHIFQFSIGLLAPLVLLFFATADWRRPTRNLRSLLLPAAALVIAFSALCYLEHYYYLAHYR